MQAAIRSISCSLLSLAITLCTYLVSNASVMLYVRERAVYRSSCFVYFFSLFAFQVAHELFFDFITFVTCIGNFLSRGISIWKRQKNFEEGLRCFPNRQDQRR